MMVISKLPVWMRLTMWGFGGVGFVSLFLAAVSMFVWIGYHNPSLRFEQRQVSVMVKSGAVHLFGRYDVILPIKAPSYAKTPSYSWTQAPQFPSLREKSLYLMEKYELEDSGWQVNVPLVSPCVLSLLVFLFFARRASEMRRKEIFAVLPPNQERP